MSLAVCPITLREARAFVAAHHRHHQAPRGCRFVVGLEDTDAGQIVGVAVVGRPSARHLDDGRTAEVTRLCVLDHHPGACSKLYAACWRAARAIGYRRLITYTLPEEGGGELARRWLALRGRVRRRQLEPNGAAPRRHPPDAGKAAMGGSMSARKHCWHCGNALYANRGRIVRYPDGEVEVHANCLVETKEWLAESAGAGVTARPKGEP